MTDGWYCEHYGPEGAAIGAVCFIASADRACDSPEACHKAMTGVRQRVYAKINELAAAGDPVCVELAETFPDPGSILNGGDS